MRYLVLTLVLAAACSGGDDPTDTDPTDTDPTDTDPADDTPDDTPADTDQPPDDTPDDTPADTDTSLPDLRGWWIPGAITEPSGTCGYTGARTTARQFDADGLRVVIPTVWEPAPRAGTAADCVPNGDVLTCTTSGTTAGAGYEYTFLTVATYTFAGDGTAAAEVEQTQTCTAGDCAGLGLCSTTYTYSLTQVLPPDPSTCAANPTMPAIEGAGDHTITATPYLVTGDAYLPALSSDNLTATDGQGGAATWLDATRFTTTTPTGGGFVRVIPDHADLLPTNLEFATWAGMYVDVPVYDRRLLDGRVLANGHHPTVPGFGHLVVSVVEWANGGNMQSTPELMPPDVSAPFTALTVAGTVAEWHFTNLCPGARTVLHDTPLGDCWVEAASDTQVADSIQVAIEADTVTRVNLRCPIDI